MLVNRVPKEAKIISFADELAVVIPANDMEIYSMEDLSESDKNLAGKGWADPGGLKTNN